MRTRKRTSRSGFTLIEILIGSFLLVVLGASVALAAARTRGAFQQTRLNASVESKLRQALSRVVGELQAVGLATVLPPNIDDEWGSSNITFQKATGAPAGAIVWGTTQRLSFEYEPGELDDGVDNDGDGLVDEGLLVFVRDDGGPAETRVVLVRDLAEFAEGEDENNADDNGNGIRDERGFNAHRVGNLLTIRLTVEGVGEGEITVARSLSATVLLRN